ncbi:hypothetical protein DJ84_02565 [Halorubrum ezzemoulense]|nr:hypothetical protein DJ84_02565 [Halorubrum ezzemoulense]
MAVNQIGLVVGCLRSAGELSLRGGPSLSAADRRRRDSVATHDCCPDRWTAAAARPADRRHSKIHTLIPIHCNTVVFRTSRWTN